MVNDTDILLNIPLTVRRDRKMSYEDKSLIRKSYMHYSDHFSSFIVLWQIDLWKFGSCLGTSVATDKLDEV